jgi:hypothetical protein
MTTTSPSAQRGTRESSGQRDAPHAVLGTWLAALPPTKMATTNFVFSAAVAGLVLASTQARADMLPPNVAACCSMFNAIPACQSAGTPCVFDGGTISDPGGDGTCQPSTCSAVVALDAACDATGGHCLGDVPCTTCKVAYGPSDAGAGDDASGPADGGSDSSAILDAGGADSPAISDAGSGGGNDTGSELSPTQESGQASGGGCSCRTTGEGALDALLPWLVAGAVPLLVRRPGRRRNP